MRRVLRLLVAVFLVVLPALPAFAKSFHIAEADVTIEVEENGTLLVTERLTYDFDGSFEGAYRDIPLRGDVDFEFVSIGDEQGSYDSGGCAWIGCSSPAGTFGISRMSGLARVIWHHVSTDETRTFELVYRMTQVVTVYDDVADLLFKVWGEEWAVRADVVTAEVILPTGASEGEVLVYGHPYGVDGETSLGQDGVSPNLEAHGVSPNTFVEIRVVFPPNLLTSSEGVTVVAGAGQDIILGEEETFAAEASEAQVAARNGLIGGALVFVLLVGGGGGLVYFRYGREPRTGYDREYEQFPPSELTPAEVGALVSQGGVTAKQVTATMFDLIRRGVISAEPAEVTRTTWGGLRKEQITDLVLGLTGTETGLRDFEQSVLTLLRRALDGGTLPLHELNEAIKEDRQANAKTFKVFGERVVDAIKRAKLLDDSGKTFSLIVAGVAVALMIGGIWWLTSALADRPGGEALIGLFIAGLTAGVFGLFIFLSFRKVHSKRTKKGALEAERWIAFRNYLSDFSRLEEAPSISLGLWDQFLVYGISLGVAEEVLEHARLYAPQELEQTSHLYWYGHHGYGGGPTQNAFAGLEAALNSSGGGGGGFSGGGGGGAGGGGGGAW